MDASLIFSLFILVALLYLSAWISSSETALFSLSAPQVKLYKENDDSRKKLIAKLLSKPRELIVTVFLINTCVNILFQNVASDMFGNHASWLLKVGVPLILALVFGEVIPKYIGLQNNEAIALRSAKKLEFWQNFLQPVRRFVTAVTTPVSKLLFFFLRKENVITKKEIEHVLNTSATMGMLSKEEAELLAGYLNLQDAEVRELMRPKEDIFFYDISQPEAKLLDLFTKEELSRIPVCKGSLDNVLGIIDIVDYFKQTPQKDLKELLSKPFFVPETMPAKALLRLLEEEKKVVALAVDEYGTLSGLISKEDLIEVVIGQIEEPGSALPLFVPAGQHEAIASGKWELAEFNDYFNSSLESSTDQVTIGGWLIERCGELPKSYEKFEYEGFQFQVLSATPTRITRLFIRKING